MRNYRCLITMSSTFSQHCLAEWTWRSWTQVVTPRCHHSLSLLQSSMTVLRNLSSFNHHTTMFTVGLKQKELCEGKERLVRKERNICGSCISFPTALPSLSLS